MNAAAFQIQRSGEKRFLQICLDNNKFLIHLKKTNM